MQNKSHTKFLFVTGGVVSSLGKGITAASIGALLETRGLKVTLSKADPYLNVDPGTMSPVQHGEVFVTEDGAETDLDLGHYERFTRARLLRKNSFSTGQVYDQVLLKERRGEYLGKTVQVVPHVTGQIKDFIYKASEGADVSIIEIGGTVGDIESQPFIETIRQIIYEQGRACVMCVHVTLVPYIQAAAELKTKPTQHSVKELRALGIQPDMLICRADRPVPEDVRQKIALFCNVPTTHVIEMQDADSIYRIPLLLHQQRVDELVLNQFNFWAKAPDLHEWHEIVKSLDFPKTSVSIAVVGKYTLLPDSYKSLQEALIHAGIAHSAKIEVRYLEASEVVPEKHLKDVDGIIVPGGFGERGIEGKMAAIRFARENQIPFLGICLGMQLACIEFAQNVLQKKASSEEFYSEGSELIIHLMEKQKRVERVGGSMRLGSYPCLVKPQTKAFQAYQASHVFERHRHRYEFNTAYRELFEENGVVFSGTSDDNQLMEIFEIKDHRWFLACQFHPELQSRPMAAHPLFRALVEKAIEYKKESKDGNNEKRIDRMGEGCSSL